VVVFDCVSKVVSGSCSSGSAPAVCVDLNASHAVAGLANGQVKLLSLVDGKDHGSFEVLAIDTGSSAKKSKTPLVDVRIHPNGEHVVVATENGSLVICRLQDESITPIGVFQAPNDDNDDDDDAGKAKYTCGALHPDGLIYVAGNTAGDLLVWDIKSQSLASTLPGADAGTGVTSVAFSANGYHIASTYSSGKVLVWDLRKQIVVTTLNVEQGNNKDHEVLDAVLTCSFDPSGKYLAYGGPGGVRITTVKEWTTVAALDTSSASFLVWGEGFLAVANSKKRDVAFLRVQE
jgi:WD40 repeat protein